MFECISYECIVTFLVKMKSSMTVLVLMLSIETSIQSIARYYEIESLLDSGGRKPYNLNIHKKTNTLFFCYNVTDRYDYRFASLNIDTREYRTIVGIRDGCAIAIDQDNNAIFLGGSDGIYKYNMNTGAMEIFMEKGVYIYSLFFSERLFYISYPEQNVYMEYQGQFARVEEFDKFQVDHFLVNRAGLVFFSVKNKIYLYDKFESEWHLKELNNLEVKQISEDNEGIVYVCSNLGVFTVSKQGLKKVMDEKNIFGLASDRDNNLILADDMSVFRLQRGIEVYVVERKDLLQTSNSVKASTKEPETEAEEEEE